jgi:hypothetical protein
LGDKSLMCSTLTVRIFFGIGDYNNNVYQYISTTRPVSAVVGYNKTTSYDTETDITRMLVDLGVAVAWPVGVREYRCAVDRSLHGENLDVPVPVDP